MPVLSIRSLSKRFELYDRPIDRLKQTLWRGHRQFFREFWALRDVEFSLEPGQALGVVGRNGSGKSTLLQLAAGTLSPTTGTVESQGRVSALLELGSGFNPEFSGRENVYLNGAILGIPATKMRELMPELLAFADIGDFVDRPVKTYSSGMALRLAFAVATAVSPQLLIVDEALAVGDEAFQRKCFARIESMREGGTAVLFVSHSPAQILELCDVALLLDGGEMLLFDEPRRVVPEYQRLLYAAPDAAARLRTRIKTDRLREIAPAADGSGWSSSVPAERASVSPASQRVAAFADGGGDLAASTQVLASEANAHPVALFDPDFRSASTVEYASHGARIHSSRITTGAGETVNLLLRGETYIFSYRVEFAVAARRIRCGMMIKALSGIELGGGLYPPSGVIEEAFLAGTTIDVHFAFHCDLFPAMYFVNAGVMGEVDGKETYLHRLVDAIAFRVQSDLTGQPSGYVDFRIASSITRVTEQDA
jgi:lipopolysaccharide transport system ATP-binding protein